MTRVTVEEKSNFKCITSGKLAFLSFDLPPILVEGLSMHGLIQKYFLHNWYFLRYHDLFDVTRVTGYKNGFLRSLDSNGFSIKPITQNNFWWTRNLTSYPILCVSYTVPSCLCWMQWPVENVTRVTQLCDSRDIVAHWTQIHTCIWLLKKQILIFQMKNSRRSYKSNNF